MRAKRAFFGDVEDSLTQTISSRLHRGSFGLSSTHLSLKRHTLPPLLCIHLTFRIKCDDGCHEVCVQLGRAGYIGSKLTLPIGAKIY